LGQGRGRIGGTMCEESEDRVWKIRAGGWKSHASKRVNNTTFAYYGLQDAKKCSMSALEKNMRRSQILKKDELPSKEKRKRTVRGKIKNLDGKIWYGSKGCLVTF